jgi:hypothetical protein
MDDVTALQQFVDGLTKGQGAYGVLGMIAACLTAGVRVLRLGTVQAALGALDPRLTWALWNKQTRLGVVFLLSAAGSILTAILTGVSWPAASVAAILSALTAIGINETSEGIGHAVGPMVPQGARPAVGLLIPMPKGPPTEEVTSPGGQ